MKSAGLPDLWLSESYRLSYRASDPAQWTGRSASPELGAQYWHQAVTCLDLSDSPATLWDALGPDTPGAFPPALIGYACDEGVRRNQGRPGARSGPAAIRASFARLACHAPEPKLLDLGDLFCIKDRLEETQQALSDVLAYLWATGLQPRVLGGGHDLSYGHFRGFVRGLEQLETFGRLPRIAVVNLDAHFDLRLAQPRAHSGSPFFQILDEFGSRATYTVLGIQRGSNTPELFDRAGELDVTYLEARDCRALPWEQVAALLSEQWQDMDGLYLSIDLDGFSSAYAPGVSAPSPMGLSPDFAWNVIDLARETGLPLALDIAELNPDYDLDGRTARLAAALLEHSICG